MLCDEFKKAGHRLFDEKMIAKIAFIPVEQWGYIYDSRSVSISDGVETESQFPYIMTKTKRI